MSAIIVTPSTTVGELRAALERVPQDAPVAVLYANKVAVDVSVVSEHPAVPWLPADTVFLRASHP